MKMCKLEYIFLDKYVNNFNIQVIPVLIIKTLLVSLIKCFSNDFEFGLGSAFDLNFNLDININIEHMYKQNHKKPHTLQSTNTVKAYL